jgi:hypothetical protein
MFLFASSQASSKSFLLPLEQQMALLKLNTF